MSIIQCGIKFIASPLKLILHQKIATLMKDDFLLVDSKLEVYQEW